MRIYKGSETTLKLPAHVCGVDDVSVDRVILYTTDAEKAITINNVYVSGETLNVRVGGNTFDLMEDGVINYIAEGKNVHIEKQSSYYLKTPKDYTAISLDVQEKEITVTKNNSTTTLKPDAGYLGLEEVRVRTEIPMNTKNEVFTENGVWGITPDDGFDGMDYVGVNVNIPISSKSVEYNWSGSYTVLPDEGYLNQVDVNINIPTTFKNVEYKDNGDYRVFPEEGDGYLSGIGVRVNVPLEYGKDMYVTTNNTAVEIEPSSGYKGVRQGKVYVEIPTQDEKVVNIVKNGTTEVLPDEGYHYIRKVNINTDVALNSVPIVPSQISFENSTWEEFDMEPYDWKYVYNWVGMFQHCKSLKRIHNFPQIQAHHTIYNMFYNCQYLEEVPYFDTSNVSDFRCIFKFCGKLTTIPQYDLSNATSTSYMFEGCHTLQSIPMLECGKLINAEYMFLSCPSLVDVGGLKNIKCNISFINCSKLTSDSIYNIIEGLYDFEYWAEEPDSTQGTLTLATSLSSVVTEEMMAMATNKKWKIIFS